MDISIPDPLRAWVEAQVAGGHYESADAYIGSLIRRDRLSLLDHGVSATSGGAIAGSNARAT